MLCPEVWNFKAPESSFSVRKSTPQQLQNTIDAFPYAHLITIVQKDPSTEDSREILSDCAYYKVSNLPLQTLVEKRFLDSFINSGSLYLLSVGTRIDCDNCVAVTPAGRLVLNLNKVTYQALGLEGAVSHYHTKTKERYVVTIDLKAKCFKPGKPNYERVAARLATLETFDVIVAWDPPNEEVCPSSVAKYFDDLGRTVKQCRPTCNMMTRSSVQMPPLQNCDEFDTMDAVEWLGRLVLHCGGLEVGTNRVRVLKCQGFFVPARIKKLVREKKWWAVYVQGFSDSPLAWENVEHHFYTNGDNGYVAFHLEKNCIVTVTENVSRKVYRNKYN